MEFRTLGEMQKYLGRMSVPTFHQHLAMYGRGGLGVKDILRRGSGMKGGVIQYGKFTQSITEEEAQSKEIKEKIKVVSDIYNSNQAFIDMFDTEGTKKDIPLSLIDFSEDELESLSPMMKNLGIMDEEGYVKLIDENDEEINLNLLIEKLRHENKIISDNIASVKNPEQIKAIEKAVRHNIPLKSEVIKQKYGPVRIAKYKGGIKALKGDKLKFLNYILDEYKPSMTEEDIQIMKNKIENFSKIINPEQLEYLKDNWKDFDEKKKNNILNATNLNELATLIKKPDASTRKVAEDRKLFPVFPHEEIQQEKKLFEKNLNESLQTLKTDVIENFKDEIKNTFNKISQSKNLNLPDKDYINWEDKMKPTDTNDNPLEGNPKNVAYENMTIGEPLNLKKYSILPDIEHNFRDPKFEFLRSVIYTADPDMYNDILKSKQNVKVRTYNANFQYENPETKKKTKVDTFAPLDNRVVITYVDTEGNIREVEIAIENKLYADIDLQTYMKENDEVMKKVITVSYVNHSVDDETIVDKIDKLENLYDRGKITEIYYNSKFSKYENQKKEIQSKKPTPETIEKNYYKEYRPRALTIKNTKTPFNPEHLIYTEDSITPKSHYKYATEAKAMKPKKILNFNSEKGTIKKITQNGKIVDSEFNGCLLYYLFGTMNGDNTVLNASKQIKDGNMDSKNIFRTNRIAENYYHKSDKKRNTSEGVALNINMFNLVARPQMIQDVPITIKTVNKKKKNKSLMK